DKQKRLTRRYQGGVIAKDWDMTKVFEHSHDSNQPWSDEDFLAELNEHISMLYPAISAQLGRWDSIEAAEDVAQNTWESAWHNRHRFDPSQGDFHSWVVTIARRRDRKSTRLNSSH